MSLLKIQRERAGLTLRQLSELTDIHPTALSKIEHGHRRITAEEVGKLSRALGCALQDLIPGHEPIEEEPTRV